MSDTSTATSEGVGSEVSMRAGIIQMAIGASLLSSTSLFFVYAQVGRMGARASGYPVGCGASSSARLTVFTR